MEKILSSLIPSLVKKGNFGPGDFKSVSLDNLDIGIQLASEICMANVNLILESGETKSIPIVIKIQMNDFETLESRDMKTMFQNEVLMYNEVLPYFNKDGSIVYPKIYYARATGGEDYSKDVLILENVNYSGYKLSPIRVYFDFEHILLGLKKIAQLHAGSFRAKYEDKESFFNMANKLKACVSKQSGNFDLDIFTYEAMKRGMEPFIKDGIEAETLTRFINSINSIMQLMRILWSAEEPFGVVIHGDYCKNNIFYKYDSEGKPVDAMYFDLQHSKYGSPVVDLSFFLYLHTTVEMRDEHWDNLLHIYWTAVRDYVPHEIPLPTFQEFLEHFASKAVYGYLPCSYFLPRMISGIPLSLEQFLTTPFKELVEDLLNVAGEEGDQSVRNVVAHLLDKKYIHKYLAYYDTNKDKFLKFM